MHGDDKIQVDGMTVSAVSNSHFDHRAQGEASPAISLSYRFQLGSRSITYTGDTGPSQSVDRLAHRTDLLVSEVIDLEPLLGAVAATRPDMSLAFFGQLREHLSAHHLSASQIGLMAKASQPARVVLTHFSIPAGPTERSEAALRAGIGEYFHGPVDLARDLSSFDVGCP